MDCKKKEVRKGRKYDERIEKNSEGEGRKERKTEQKKGKGGSRQGKGQGYIPGNILGPKQRLNKF